MIRNTDQNLDECTPTQDGRYEIGFNGHRILGTQQTGTFANNPGNWEFEQPNGTSVEWDAANCENAKNHIKRSGRENLQFYDNGSGRIDFRPIIWCWTDVANNKFWKVTDGYSFTFMVESTVGKAFSISYVPEGESSAVTVDLAWIDEDTGGVAIGYATVNLPFGGTISFRVSNL